MGRSLSFFTGAGGSGVIRGKQIAEKVNGRLNPPSNYDDDVCIYVKCQPPENHPRRTYYDIVDETRRFRWLKDHPAVGILATSITAYNYLSERYPGREIVLIPEHHCNFDREERTREEVKVVGVIGHPRSVEFDVGGFSRSMADIGLEFKPWFDKNIRDRKLVVEYYKGIDIQVIWRPRFSEDGNAVHGKQLHNPLKLINAMSFGIPTVAYPELNFTDELNDHFIHARTLDDLVGGVELLACNPAIFRKFSRSGIAKSHEYHIDTISERYKRLAVDENINCSMSGKLLDRKIRVGGVDRWIYGLASFRVSPKRQGLGRACLRGLEDIANANGRDIVAFCSDDVLSFYLKCGWHKIGSHKGLNLISNKPLVDVKVAETW